MRALLLVGVVACSSERTSETAAQVQARCEGASKLALTLVGERALFPRRIQVATERLERALRRQLPDHPELQPLQERAKTLINEAISTRASHLLCQSAFEVASDELTKECGDADAAGTRVWTAFRELADQLATSSLGQADRDKLTKDVTEFTESADQTLASILSPVADCPRKPLSAR